jgi:hypothetical protein
MTPRYGQQVVTLNVAVVFILSVGQHQARMVPTAGLPRKAGPSSRQKTTPDAE